MQMQPSFCQQLMDLWIEPNFNDAIFRVKSSVAVPLYFA
jgi:hypothetical protein